MRAWVIGLAVASVLAAPAVVRADAFDHYINPILAKAPAAAGVLKLREATIAQLAEHTAVLPNLSGAFLIVKTNEGRWSKLLVQPARQRIDDERSVPILLIERFVTYREGEERTIVAQGTNIRLFEGFVFHLDIGQVVPAELGGDLRVVGAAGKIKIEPIGKAELYLLTKPLPAAAPKKTAKLVVGEVFEPKYFTGVYKLHDDGRRTGTLHLKVDDEGRVTGSFYSDRDGQKYEVNGKIGAAPHSIQLTILYPRTEQHFQGWMFTADGRFITGSARMQQRETGFYAQRLEE